VFWPGPDPGTLAVRIDDQPGSPPYADRFQHEFTVTQGWNRVHVPRAGWERKSGGRPMDVAKIHSWGVFLVSAPTFDYFLLDAVQLEARREAP
jgi:hypothetical protein